MPTHDHSTTVAGIRHRSRARPERPVNLSYKCRALVENDPDAGRLLAFVVRWHRKARLTRKGEPGVWNANSRAFIIQEAGLESEEKRVLNHILETVIPCEGKDNRVFQRRTSELMLYFIKEEGDPQVHEKQADDGLRRHGLRVLADYENGVRVYNLAISNDQL